MISDKLPRYLTPFIGRTDEIIELSQLLENPECRLLTLVGPGGIGKTRLAVEIARNKQCDFPDGVYFVALQPLRSADQLLSAIIETLELQVSGGDAQRDTLGYLTGKQLLLILDNFEHLLPGATFISKILDLAPNVKVLLTSRQVVQLLGEWPRYVSGLPYPESEQANSNDDFSAINLFANHALRINSQFSVAAERRHIIKICQMVGGIPLAIELAAAWCDVLSCQEIARRLKDSLDILNTKAHNVQDRHKSMIVVLDESWQQLSDQDQAVFRRMAVFRGGFSYEAAMAVAQASPEVLRKLVRASWLQLNENRYELHELLRQFAEECLAAAGESQNIEAAHSAYFTSFLQQREPAVKGKGQFEAFREIATDFENIRTAWHWAVDHQAYDYIDQGMECLYRYTFNQHLALLDNELFVQAAQHLQATTTKVPIPIWGRLVVRLGSGSGDILTDA